MIMMNNLPVVPDLQWVSREDSQFNFVTWMCDTFTTVMISTTADKKLESKFVELRRSHGEHVNGRMPDQAIHVDCQLIYPTPGRNP